MLVKKSAAKGPLLVKINIAFTLMSMEAVLLEKSDSASTMARLAEAVTYRLL